MSILPPPVAPSPQQTQSSKKTKFTPKGGRPLTPYEREIVTILQEECAEVIVAASKLLRFGIGNTNPTTGEINTTELSLEIGDLEWMLLLVEEKGITDKPVIRAGMKRKRERLARFLQTEPV